MNEKQVKQSGEKDCREAFSKIRPKILRQWIIIILIFIGFVPYVWLIETLLKNTRLNNYTDYAVFGYGAFYLYHIFKLNKFTCPACSKSLYVDKYVFKVPITFKTWVSKYCQHCGVKLK